MKSLNAENINIAMYALQHGPFNRRQNSPVYQQMGRAYDVLAEMKKEVGKSPWLDPSRGPASEWKDGVQILHPVLVIREDWPEASMACWCDMNDEWLLWDRAGRTRIDDVLGWMPLPAVPASEPAPPTT